MNRAILYARVSTTGHGQDVGLQLDELRQVAAQRGWAVVAEHSDTGFSGGDRERPGLAAALDLARRGHADILAVWKLDRLARDVAHLLSVAEDLERWGVGLASARDLHVDTTSAQGRFTLQILGSVAELEKAMIRERVVAGLDRARRAGTRLGRPPVRVDLEAARALRAQGWSFRRVARSLGVSEATIRRRLASAG